MHPPQARPFGKAQHEGLAYAWCIALRGGRSTDLDRRQGTGPTLLAYGDVGHFKESPQDRSNLSVSVCWCCGRSDQRGRMHVYANADVHVYVHVYR